MNFCEKCNIYIEKEKCPLCNINTIKKEKKHLSNDYPKFVDKNKNILPKILLINTLVLGLFFVMVNIFFYEDLSAFWSLITCYGCFIAYVFLRLVIFSKKNLSIRIIVSHVLILSLIIFVNIFTFNINVGFWSLTYVMPILAIVFLGITIYEVVKTNSYPDFFGNIILHILFLCIPIVLYLSFDNLITNIVLSIISFVIAMITLLVLFVVPTKKTKEEIKKRLHI